MGRFKREDSCSQGDEYGGGGETIPGSPGEGKPTKTLYDCDLFDEESVSGRSIFWWEAWERIEDPQHRDLSASCRWRGNVFADSGAKVMVWYGIAVG